MNFFQPQNWYVFYLNTDLNFFLKFFSFYEIADFEISKKELRVRLKSFFLICDACIISLSYEYESSFNKSHFFLPFQKQIWFFYKPNLIFYNFSKQIWFFSVKIIFSKTDLIFYKSNLFSFSFSFSLNLTKTDLIFY